MKRTHILYIMLAMVLGACSHSAPDEPKGNTSGLYGMNFVALLNEPSRSSGVFEGEIYPVDRLYLTAFHIDRANLRQIYFDDVPMDATEIDGVRTWSIADWYWPLQGDMAFLSYWSPGVSGAPYKLDMIVDVDGNEMRRMNIDATALDGHTDFIYLSQNEVPCPQVQTVPLMFNHGLTWLTVSVQAEVLNDDATDTDPTKTAELIAHLRINKVVIEDCARRGLATVVPGIGIKWKTYDDTDETVDPISFTRDQVYYISAEDTPGQSIGSYTWRECPDASDETAVSPVSYFTLTSGPQDLGVYTANAGYAGKGLLIVPQNKTAITVDYTVINHNGDEVHKVERYELRDNSVSWLPGCHYDYKIVFRNYNDYESNFYVIANWEKPRWDPNFCYSDFRAYLYSQSNDNVYSNFSQICVDPMHHGGSVLGDEMDYGEGPRVF